MNIKKIALNCFLAAALAACSSSGGDGGTSDGGKTDGGGGTDTSGGGTDTAGGGTDTAGGTDAPKTDSKPATDTGGGDDSACGAETTNSKCQNCCATNHMDSYNAFAAALLGCACADGVCKTQCATEACATPIAPATATCQKCLGDVQSTTCKAPLDTCKAGACAPFFDCASTQCAGKT